MPIGYYYGYKGYRFAGTAANRLPLTDFSQVAAIYDFDTQLKALFYPRVMSIETVLKDFRNAIAHNGVVLDVRFQSGAINTGVSQLLKQETGVGKVDFADITDYVVLLVFLMRRMGFTKTECKQLITGYEAIIERYRAELPFNVFSRIIKTTARGKLTALRQFVSTG